MNRATNPYKRHRFPPAIIRYAVWLQHRFKLSHRDIDQDGDVVDFYRQPRRSVEAAKRFFRRLIRSHGTNPRKIVTDKLGGMRRFSSPEQAQRFLSARAVVYSLFNLQRHLASATFHRLRRARAFKHWNEAVPPELAGQALLRLMPLTCQCPGTEPDHRHADSQ